MLRFYDKVKIAKHSSKIVYREGLLIYLEVIFPDASSEYQPKLAMVSLGFVLVCKTHTILTGRTISSATP